MLCADITFSQFIILDYARRPQPLCIGDLNVLLGVEKSTTSRLIKPLIDKGLLTRNQDPKDGRRFVLQVSPRGETVHDAVWTCFSGAAERFFLAVPEEDRSRVVSAMPLMSQAFLACCGKEPCCR